MDTSIVSVTVYPQQARVTRRGSVDLAPGPHRIEIGGLPLGLHHDSVRVSGRGPATVRGVDVTAQVNPRSPDARVTELEQRRDTARNRVAELDDARSLTELRKQTVLRSGSSYARWFGRTEPSTTQLAEVNDALAQQMSSVLADRRAAVTAHEHAVDELAALERELAALREQRAPDRTAVLVDVESSGGSCEFELSYVVRAAGWTSHYDIRLVDTELTLTWFGQVTQTSGEDWPDCELQLSTARPAVSAQVPELDPWYLDRRRPPIAPMARTLGAAPPPGAPAPAAMDFAERAPMPVAKAAVEHGVTATTYTPERTVAVPADGSAHSTTIAVTELTAALDYVTVPVRGAEAYLRASAANSSEYTYLPGKAAVFHGAEFVGTTRLELWAPGEELELNMGVDDRIRVERELIRRTAGRALLGGTRKREAAYRITVGNYAPRQATVTVLDQIPVSRDDAIAVKDVVCKPEPRSRTDLGELEWQLDLAPERSATIDVSFRVDVAKGVEIAGWRD